MTILETAVIVLAVVLVLQAVALGLQSRRIDELESRIRRVEQGDIAIRVRGTPVGLGPFLGKLLRHLGIQVDHQPECVVLKDEESR